MSLQTKHAVCTVEKTIYSDTGNVETNQNSSACESDSKGTNADFRIDVRKSICIVDMLKKTVFSL